MAQPPTFESLVKHLDRFGPEGIMETAKGIRLPDHLLEQLERLVKEKKRATRKK